MILTLLIVALIAVIYISTEAIKELYLEIENKHINTLMIVIVSGLLLSIIGLIYAIILYFNNL